ncbi:RNA-directed DNA polymerase, partial [Phytophthora megakarya]
MAGVMPNILLVVENAHGINIFGLFDFITGFWQFPLAELCQEWFSYMTDEKLFTRDEFRMDVAMPQPTSRKPWKNASPICFISIYIFGSMVCSYIDPYLERQAEIFSLLHQFGLNLSVQKLSLYQQEVAWCGRLINGSVLDLISKGLNHYTLCHIQLLLVCSSGPWPSRSLPIQGFILGCLCLTFTPLLLETNIP